MILRLAEKLFCKLGFFFVAGDPKKKVGLYYKPRRLKEGVAGRHPLLELVSKELNHLAAILHVYAGGLNFMK
jgi:hypothetical protein